MWGIRLTISIDNNNVNNTCSNDYLFWCIYRIAKVSIFCVSHNYCSCPCQVRILCFCFLYFHLTKYWGLRGFSIFRFKMKFAIHYKKEKEIKLIQESILFLSVGLLFEQLVIKILLYICIQKISLFVILNAKWS